MRIPDVPLLYTDEEALEITQAVDEAVSLAGVHSWLDVTDAGMTAGVLDEAEVPS